MIFQNESGWGIYRDYKKTLATKNLFTGSNAQIRAQPALHPMAIYLGVKSEKASRMLEDILWERVSSQLRIHPDFDFA